MSHVVVFNGPRQYKIQTSPSKILFEVLVEVCGLAGLAHQQDHHGLRHGKNMLDLSLPMRLSRLPQGAKLELTFTSKGENKEVLVALQVGNDRRILSVKASLSLWDILLLFEQHYSKDGLQLTTRSIPSPKSGIEMCEQPIVQLMNKDYGTVDILKSTTLVSQGIRDGSALLRVTFKVTDLPVPGGAVQGRECTDEVVKVDNEASEQAHQIPLESQKLVEMELVDGPNDKGSEIGAGAGMSRDIEVFSAPTSVMPFFAISDPVVEEGELTVDQARIYQNVLKQNAQASSAPLMTRDMREAKALEKRRMPERCRVKFRFHDGEQVTATFLPTEKVCNLYEFVRSIITTPSLPFDLSTTNDMTANLADPQVLLPRKTRLVESNPGLLWLNHAFGQGTVLQIVSDTTQTDRPTLLAEILAKQRDIAEVISLTSRAEVPDVEAPIPKSEEVVDKKDVKAASTTSNGAKIPKWLKLKKN